MSKDARLFKANRFTIIAEVRLVIKINRNNGRDIRFKGVNRIKPPAQADLHHRDIDAPGQQPLQRVVEQGRVERGVVQEAARAVFMVGLGRRLHSQRARRLGGGFVPGLRAREAQSLGFVRVSGHAEFDTARIYTRGIDASGYVSYCRS